MLLSRFTRGAAWNAGLIGVNIGPQITLQWTENRFANEIMGTRERRTSIHMTFAQCDSAGRKNWSEGWTWDETLYKCPPHIDNGETPTLNAASFRSQCWEQALHVKWALILTNEQQINYEMAVLVWCAREAACHCLIWVWSLKKKGVLFIWPGNQSTYALRLLQFSFSDQRLLFYSTGLINNVSED